MNEKNTINKYVTNFNENVFAIYNLPEEIIAVLFAYYSRQKQGLRETLINLLQENNLQNDGNACDLQTSLLEQKARTFHEKWVIGYGHSSVAEHAIIHLGIENFSILAIKELEKARLASFTEKSTRYVLFSPDKIYIPPLSRTLQDKFKNVTGNLISTYIKWHPVIVDYIQNKKLNSSKRDLQAHACDIARYLLPAATLTNCGITVNARELGNIIRRLAVHPVEEFATLGNSLQKEGVKVAPALLRHLEGSSFWKNFYNNQKNNNSIVKNKTNEDVKLISHNTEAIKQLAATIYFELYNISYNEAEEKISLMQQEDILQIIDEYIMSKGEYETAGRALERIEYLFELTMDYGAFRDIQRHRITTQYEQLLNTSNGYMVPESIIELNLDKSFKSLMNEAALLFREIERLDPFAAQYILPLAFRKRVLIKMNLRELMYFIKLRSRLEGHPSYRKISQDIYHKVIEVHPWLEKYFSVDLTPAKWNSSLFNSEE